MSSESESSRKPTPYADVDKPFIEPGSAAAETSQDSAVQTDATPQPELLAPAGDRQCVSAAIENGADAIYFGLDSGLNARYRATNFGLADLPDLMAELRVRGVRGYVTLNTLVFPEEMQPLVPIIAEIAEAGVDAVLVQDWGVARMVRTICPELEVHASTQMSLTSAETIAVAAELGLSRVVLARELSVREIAAIRRQTEMPLEAFIHGALCVAYSGQCLTSESLGGRSANRGQCAQACRLPYELVVDGEDRDLGDVRYLLSPQDLAGYAAIPDMLAAGVDSLKIEGRLKTPEYVANITRHYRRALDQAIREQRVTVTPEDQREMELSFSRGFTPGWLEGNNHKRLVPGVRSAKQGIPLGTVLEHRGDEIRMRIQADVRLGDGLAIASAPPTSSPTENPYAGSGHADNHQGGRVYSIRPGGKSSRSRRGPHRGDARSKQHGDNKTSNQKEASAGEEVWIGFGRGDIDFGRIEVDAEVFKNDDPKLRQRLTRSFTGPPKRLRSLQLEVWAEVGKPLRVRWSVANPPSAGAAQKHIDNDTRLAPDTIHPTPIVVETIGEDVLQRANRHPITEDVLLEKLGRLGGTPFQAATLVAHRKGGPMVPLGTLNAMRREAVDALIERLKTPPVRHVDREAGGKLLSRLRVSDPQGIVEDVGGSAPAAARLTALCRTMDQLEAAIRCRVDRVVADFHDVRQHRMAVEAARAAGIPIYLASLRIQKPGEMGLLKQIVRYQPDGLLARNLAAIRFGRDAGLPVSADFSLNVSNHRSAEWLRSLGVEMVTVSYDLNADQLFGLVRATPPEWLEVVIHQHMPMFHMEHCVFCAVLSPGTNKTNCGRPCDRHAVQLRDRVGKLHVLQADIGCRNTLYNATPQSGADVVDGLRDAGVGAFRVEMVDEDAATSEAVFRTYQKLLAGEMNGSEVWRKLAADNRLGVTRGTLEAKRNPLAIL